MPTAAQITAQQRVIPWKPEPWVTTGHSGVKVPFNNCSARPRKSALDTDDEDTLNDIESLKKGIIKTSKDKSSYTILLVGETGVRKSSILELIANVFAGNDIDHYNFRILDHTNEQGGSNNQSQTNSPCLYELMSKNGIIIRILDTPGLADTHGLQQDKLHKKSIVAQIEKHVGSLAAVLVLANGTLPSISVGTHYALSTLTSILPDTMANNIAFVLTNVSNPLYQNFSAETLPDVFKGAPQFLLDDPIPLQRMYLRLKDVPEMKERRAGMRETVKTSKENALETLVELFNWLGGLEQQPTTEVECLYEKSQNIVINITDALAQQMKKLLRKVMEKATRKVRRMFII